MSFGEYFQAFGSLGDGIREAQDRAQQKSALAKLGDQLAVNDYAGAAKTAFAAGDAGTGLKLFSLGQGAAQSRESTAALNGLIGGLYGGGGTPQAPTFSGGGGSAPMTIPGSNTEIENRFVGALKDGGLTNPYGLAAAAAYARRESGYSPSKITGAWSDPSESGQAGTSGGILSWRADRLDNMRAATAGAKDPVSAQAKFFLTEDPNTTLALQNAKSAEEANDVLAKAWKFAGYNRPGGGEYAARLGTTRAYVNRLNGSDAPAPVASTDAIGGIPSGMNPGSMAMRGAPLPPRRPADLSAAPIQVASVDPSFVPQASPVPTMAPPARMAPQPMMPPPATPAAVPSMVGQPPPAEIGVDSNILDAPMRPSGAAPMAVPPSAPSRTPQVIIPQSMAGSGVPGTVLNRGEPVAQVAAAQPAPGNDDDSEDGPAPPAAAAPVPIPPQARAQVSTQAPQHLEDAGLPRQVSAPVAATQPASQARIAALLRASMLPGLSEGQTKVVSTLLNNELEQTKLPESVKQYIFAKSPAGGGFDGSFADFQNKKGDEGAKITAQLQAREQYAIAHGMNPKDAGVQAWIMGGKTTTGHVLKPGDILAGPSGQTLAQNAAAASSMSDETAGFLADRVLAGDTKALIGLGRGQQGAENLAKIQGLVAQRAREQGLDPTDIQQRAAEAAGLGAQARTLGTQAGRMSAAATEAEGAISLARTASAAVPRGSFVPLNRLSQAIQSNTGDPSLKAFNAANNTLVNTFARAISPSGVGTVADKEHAREMLSTADSPQAYEAVLQQMQAEIDMAHKAPQRARTILEGERQAAKRGGGDTPAPTMVPNPVAPDRRAAPQAAPVNAPKPAAVDYLRQNPGARDEFDAKFGPGASDRVLGPRARAGGLL
ncbi:hypothetical protein MKK88_05785 [Methylobacterium sp. E-005]|uniref:hypothetical protein n=1 Tax=Methylobacterium sp. E-005 TaxID=2836549 RepID=UPI001FB9B1C6|nr:hypothetical protein [Methylobacterium sp. E-005]MCJ2085505.1 hypothetical protein [Methylobacterium sp. E-005]